MVSTQPRVSPEQPEDRSRRRGVLVGLGVGLGVALAMVGIGVSIVAIPLFLLAQVIEPGSRIDHPFLRQGLLGWALPVGLVLGVVSGVLVGVWYGRGGRLPPQDDHPTYLP